MESKIPLPTDNIYKFYALFGLLLTIFSLGSSLYINKSTNDLVFAIAVEYQTLKENSQRSVSEETLFNVLEKKLEIAGKDKKALLWASSVVLTIGILLLFYGFRKWHSEVQPIQDQIAQLSLLKLKRELGEDTNV